MYRTFFALIILFFSNLSLAQTLDVFVDVEKPYKIAFKDNYLYVLQCGIGQNQDKISKVDITADPSTVVDVVTGLHCPFDLVFNGDELYFSELGIPLSTGGKISKIDITDNSPTITELVTGLDRPFGLALNENDLYFAESGEGKVSKIDITDNNLTVTEVVTGLSQPYTLTLDGNDLYIIEIASAANKISKIDITVDTPIATDIISTGTFRPYELIPLGNELYTVGYNPPEGGKISTINITSNPIAIIDLVIGGIFSPRGLALKDNFLYYSEISEDRISKLDLNTLSIDNLSLKNEIKIYPNPSSQFIHLEGLNAISTYSIYNLLGEKISSGIISKNQNVKIKILAVGMYFLKFDDGTTLKFIKK